MIPRRLLIAPCALSLLLAPQIAKARVDPDCFTGEWSFTCAVNRVDEAKEADKLFGPVLERRGWNWGCYAVQYVKGDGGGRDTLLVIVHGRKGSTPPACTTPSRANQQAAMAPSEIAAVADELKHALLRAPKPLRDQLLRDTKMLSVGNGYGGAAEVPLL